MKTVFCHGVWDMLHPGHIAHLQEAKSFGDKLIVGVTADEWVNKGSGRPIFTQEQRRDQLQALGVVDMVLISYAPTCVGILNSFDIDIYAKGPDYTYETLLPEERDIMERRGIKFLATTAPKLSSTVFYNRLVSPYPPETQQWLASFSKRHSIDEILEALDRLKSLSVLIAGEWIIDQYIQVETLAKSPREHHMSSRYLSTQNFNGGSIMVDKHIHGFVGHTCPLQQRREIRKTRFLDKGYGIKMFGVQVIPDPLLGDGEEKEILYRLRCLLSDQDVVMVLDYGHGFFTPAIQQEIETHAKFLAVNCQTNSANYGRNLITKWKRADYVSMDRPEHELALANGWDPTSVESVMVTNGSQGCNMAVHVPALARDVKDRLGAGDALFAVTAPLVALGTDPEIVAFVGNCAAAIHCGVIGNEKPIERQELTAFIRKVMV